MEPDPSSSAPFTIESTRAGRCLRRLSLIARIRAASSGRRVRAACRSRPGDGSPCCRPAGCRGSTGGTMPMASLCAPSATYSPRSAGSEPSSTATTLVAGIRCPQRPPRPAAAGRCRPGWSASSGLPNSLLTEAVGTNSMRGWVTPGGAWTASLTSSFGVPKIVGELGEERIDLGDRDARRSARAGPAGPGRARRASCPWPSSRNTTSLPLSASRGG